MILSPGTFRHTPQSQHSSVQEPSFLNAYLKEKSAVEAGDAGRGRGDVQDETPYLPTDVSFQPSPAPPPSPSPTLQDWGFPAADNIEASLPSSRRSGK